mmetsp:Transcript_57943/g.163615  ORF Transcript_57943/g.163615 Transcript_57943/m.163615 type:complete len:204 (-) Transcript_57943:218-829(-)
MHAPSAPPATPRAMSIGPCNAFLRTSPWPRARPLQRANPDIATTSSKEAAATTKDGMPFSVPYPCLCRLNMPPTTMAGDTAPRMKPSDSPRASGIENIYAANAPVTTASVTPGITVRRTTHVPRRRTAPKSISRPPRMRMFMRPTARIAAAHGAGNPRAKSPAFFTKIPVHSIPSSGGSPTSFAACPPATDPPHRTARANPLL